MQEAPKNKRLLLERGTLKVKNHPGIRVAPWGHFEGTAYLVLYTESASAYARRKKREAKYHKV